MEDLEKVDITEEKPIEEPTQEVVDPVETKKPKKSKIKKILTWVFGGLFAAIIALSATIVIGTRTGDGYVFGKYQFPIVLTDSMCPDYPVNSGLVIKKVHPSNIKVGDDVMFKWVITVGGQDMETNMTHRIFEVTKNPEGAQYAYTYKAHGINTHSEFCKVPGETGMEYGDCTDITDSNNVQIFHETSVVGKVVAKSVVMGGFMTFVQSPFGLIVLILVPAFYVMITSVIDIFKKLPDDDDEEPATAGATNTGTKVPETKPGEDPLAGLSEEEIEKLKKQLYKELLGKGGKKK